MGKKKIKKARDKKMTLAWLQQRADGLIARGYSKPKYIEFCEAMITRGFDCVLYEAKETFSKYVTVTDGKKAYKVRFSNHKPIKHRELAGDCDFFVGITHTGTRTTFDAIKAVIEFFACDFMAGRAPPKIRTPHPPSPATIAKMEKRKAEDEILLTGQWLKRSASHWTKLVGGKRLEFWPEVNKFQYDGRVHQGDVMAFITKTEGSDCVAQG